MISIFKLNVAITDWYKFIRFTTKERKTEHQFTKFLELALAEHRLDLAVIPQTVQH